MSAYDISRSWTRIEDENFGDNAYYLRIEVDGKPLIADDGFLEGYELPTDDMAAAHGTATDDRPAKDIATDDMAPDSLICKFDVLLADALRTEGRPWIRYLVVDFEVFEACYKLCFSDIKATACYWRYYLYKEELCGIMFVKGGDEHMKRGGAISKHLVPTENKRVTECSELITDTWLQYIQKEEEKQKQRELNSKCKVIDSNYPGFPVFAMCSLTKDVVSTPPSVH